MRKRSKYWAAKEIWLAERMEAYKNWSDESKSIYCRYSHQRQLNNEQSESRCSTQNKRGWDIVETSLQRAERLEVLSKTKEERLRWRQLKNKQSNSRCCVTQSMEDWDGDIKSTTNRATGVLSKITISKIWDRNPKFEHFEVDYYWTYNTSATSSPKYIYT